MLLGVRTLHKGAELGKEEENKNLEITERPG